jgi:arylsulfatase A-like enzyme
MRKGRLDLRDEVDPAYLQSLVDKYDTAVRYTTDQVARILAVLSNRGLFDNTLIIITADHGEELFDHGGFNHGTSMYRELLHVPLYVKMPGQRQGSRVSAPVSLLDIVPTVLDVAGLRSLHDLDGTSLVPLLEQPLAAASFDRRPRVYQCAWRNHFVGSAIARGNFKLVRIDSNYERVTDAWLLYDLESDPGEHSDLSEIRGEVVSRLRYDLERAIARYESQAGPVPEDRRALLDRDLDRLRALGYVE